jgi:hypothetical protein
MICNELEIMGNIMRFASDNTSGNVSQFGPYIFRLIGIAISFLGTPVDIAV